jgi:hypothetical protein
MKFTRLLEYDVAFVEASGKWQVCLTNGLGEQSLSDQVYDTLDEAEAAFLAWVNDTGATVQRLQ